METLAPVHLSNEMHQQYKCSAQSLSLGIYTPSFRYLCSLVSPKIQKMGCQVQSVFILKWTFILWKMMCFDNGNPAIHFLCHLLLYIKLTFPLCFLFSGLLNTMIRTLYDASFQMPSCPLSKSVSFQLQPGFGEIEAQSNGSPQQSMKANADFWEALVASYSLGENNCSELVRPNHIRGQLDALVLLTRN